MAFPGLIAQTGRLENECLRVEFSAEGRMTSLYDKKAAREVLAPGEWGNDLVIIPDTGDAWDFQTDHANKDVWGYLKQPPARPRLHSTHAHVDGPCARLEQVWRVGGSEIRQVVSLFAGADSLVFATDMDWRESAHMLRVRFPVAVQADEARFEIPFGFIRRSTLDDTVHRHAQIEVAALQWVDLSQADHGVALFNDCKYGFRVKGHMIDMALIRSVPYPGAPLIGKDDKADGQAASVYGDLGRHVFTYALRPHAGPGDAAELTAAARMLNTPPAIVAARPPDGPASAPPIPAAPAFALGSPAVELAAIKPAEDGQGWALRLVNVGDGAVTASFAAAAPGIRWTECDLAERCLPCAAAGAVQEEGGARLVFHPFEIKTLRIRPFETGARLVSRGE